jgi:hypothetical protein
VNIAQYIFQKVVILVKSARFIRSNTGKILPVYKVPNTGKPVSVLPVLETLSATAEGLTFSDTIHKKVREI